MYNQLIQLIIMTVMLRHVVIITIIVNDVVWSV